MPIPHPKGEIDAEAADWAVRIDAGDLSPSETRRLEGWLDADRRHRGAFARARAVLHAVGQVRPPVVAPRARRLDRRAVMLGGAMAASAVGGVILVARREPGLRVETGIGETRRLALSDGSVAVIDSRSRARAVLTSGERRVMLEAGEAWLSLTQDATRPFSLVVGSLHARANVATEMIVRLRDEGARLTVIQGEVEAWRGTDPAVVERLGAGGEVALAVADGVLRTAQLGEDLIRRRIGWREGLLVLDGETLGAAARELNHYNERKVEVAGAAANLRVVGAFRNTDPEGFARAMNTLFGTAVRIGSDRIVIG